MKKKKKSKDNMGTSEKLLVDIIKEHAVSASSLKFLMDNILEVLTTLGERMEVIEDYILSTKVAAETYRKYMTKIFVVVFLVQLTVIGLLLGRLNTMGADVVSDVSSSALRILP